MPENTNTNDIFIVPLCPQRIRRHWEVNGPQNNTFGVFLFHYQPSMPQDAARISNSDIADSFLATIRKNFMVLEKAMKANPFGFVYVSAPKT